MIKNKLQLILKNLFLILFSFSTIIGNSQSTNYFETSKNIEIFTDLYKELDIFYVDEVNSGDLIKGIGKSFLSVKGVLINPGETSEILTLYFLKSKSHTVLNLVK